jgi:hypothetical protein
LASSIADNSNSSVVVSKPGWERKDEGEEESESRKRYVVAHADKQGEK